MLDKADSGQVQTDDLHEETSTRQTRIKCLIPHEVLARKSADWEKIQYLLNRRFEEERCRIEILKIELAAARDLLQDLLDSTTVDQVAERMPKYDVPRQARLFIEYSLPVYTREQIKKLKSEFESGWSSNYKPKNMKPFHMDYA
jgi:hypothetical protein